PDIYDLRAFPRLLSHELEQAARFVAGFARVNFKAQIRSIERRDEQQWVVEVQAPDDIALRRRRRCGGERQDWTGPKRGHNLLQREVRWAEIVAPLAPAGRFVNHKKLGFQGHHQLAKSRQL